MRKIGIAVLMLILVGGAQAQGKLKGQLPDDVKAVEQKMGVMMQLLRYLYVDEMDLAPIVEKGSIEMLKLLDPHSAYIPAKDVEKANEPLQGNFDGIGVSFQINKDTIVVVEVIAGGPSEKLGIMAGDKIVEIDGKKATGDSATNAFVFKNLRGEKGTTVEVLIRRNSMAEPLLYKIVRDKIPIHSVETYFMVDKEIGYVCLERFSRNSTEEMRQALKSLKAEGMKHLILDLRGNTGGFLNVATELLDEFLPKNCLTVYMEGQAQKREDYKTQSSGDLFEKGRLVVLIDENSASASEIVAGAIQDWDRGIIVGRRSFGKGLVQRPFTLPDQSLVRLTIARYYTPSGRFIQKPYEDGYDSYIQDIMNRYAHGEMVYPDSVKLPDSLKFYTQGQRVVYGGGGIMPDIFVPIDTQRLSDYYVDLRRKNILNGFTMEYLSKNRNGLLETYPDVNTYIQHFPIDDLMPEFYAYAEGEGVKMKHWTTGKIKQYASDLLSMMMSDSALEQCVTYVEYMDKMMWSREDMMRTLMKKAQEEDLRQKKANEVSGNYVKMQLKALIARNLYGVSAYFRTIKDLDDGYGKAVEVIRDKQLFKKYQISY